MAYFAILPTWGDYAQMYVKDTLYAGVFCAFFTCAALFAAGKGKLSRPVAAGFVASAVLCVLIRNNGLYVVAPSAAALIFAARGRTRKIVAGAALAAAVAGFAVVNAVVLPAAGVEKGSVREALSLPFQQTARWCVRYPDEAAEYRDVIDAVLDFDAVSANYDPRVSDPVKDTYHGDSDALGEYLKMWAKIGLRHPGLYVEAAANLAFGYFTPGYIHGPYGGAFFKTLGEAFDIDVAFANPEAVARVDSFNRAWATAPGLSHLIAPATYAWALILCAAALLRKRRIRALALTLPLWLTLAVNCVSPVCGLVRYVLPMMACTPLLVAVTLRALRPGDEPGEPGGE